MVVDDATKAEIGPPLAMHWTPQRVAKQLEPFGFQVQVSELPFQCRNTLRRRSQAAVIQRVMCSRQHYVVTQFATPGSTSY